MQILKDLHRMGMTIMSSLPTKAVLPTKRTRSSISKMVLSTRIEENLDHDASPFGQKTVYEIKGNVQGTIYAVTANPILNT